VKVCGAFRCPELTRGAYCEIHERERRSASAKRRRRSPEQLAYAGVGAAGRAWRKARAEYVRLHPICDDESGCIAPTEHVHHLDGEGPLGARGLDPSNFQGLCASHHNRKTAREAPGGWNAR
jgi:5-methylcytosine-specific restriction enzyme A